MTEVVFPFHDLKFIVEEIGAEKGLVVDMYLVWGTLDEPFGHNTSLKSMVINQGHKWQIWKQ